MPDDPCETPWVRAIIDSLRSGDWLNQRRMQTYCYVLIASYVATIGLMFATAHGSMDVLGRPIGTDFSEVWTAGRSALAGHPTDPFYSEAHEAAQKQLFGPDTQFYGWHYPPYFLVVAAGLALLPYLPALVVWQATTLTLYLVGIRKIIDQPLARLCAIAFPAVLVNLGHGHNGFLTAGLLTFGCLFLARHRDAMSGIMFALVAYKPQLGIVLPVALLASSAWLALTTGALTVAAMTALTIGWFGIDVWSAFLENLWFTRQVVLEQGDTGWEKIQSVFSAVRMVGGSVNLAYATQSLVSLIVIGFVALLWRSPADRRLKASSLLAAALLTTPYCLDYDMMLLGPALAFIVSHCLIHGFRPWEKSLLAIIWAAPLFARAIAQTLSLPVGLIAIAGLFVLSTSRGLRRVPILLVNRPA